MSHVGRMDHIAVAVPSVADQVRRFVSMGLTVQSQSDTYALVADPASGFKIELNQEPGEARFATSDSAVTTSTLFYVVPSGLLLSTVVSAISAVACTRSIGRVFIEHFEGGATLNDFRAPRK